MAKGRKLTTSRSELFLGNSGYNYQTQGAAANASSELGEEDIWSVADDTVNGGDDHSVYGDFISRATTHISNGSFSTYRSRRQPSRADGHQVGGLSFAFDDFNNTTPSQTILHQFRPQDGATESPRGRHVANSAPMNVPDWSKIYRVNSVESLHDTDDCFNESEIVPPHEYLAAREYASSRKMAAYSVFEGVGRTLKGRDMSRVRDAVWSQTGFNG